MTTTTAQHHRPAPFIAAAAAVAALAVGGVAWSVTHEPDQQVAPGGPSQVSEKPDPPLRHHFQPTTSGGRVMIGN